MLNLKRLPFLVLLLISLLSRAQSIDNLKIAFDGNDIAVTYDLVFTDPSAEFDVKIYSSHDGYSAPIQFIAGDVGSKVHAGKNKTAKWFLRNTLPSDFEGDVSIKIKAAKVIKAPALAAAPLAKTKYKKGQNVDVVWNGGAPTSKVSIELMKDGVAQEVVVQNTDNKKSYKWKVPKGFKGDGYSFQITNGSEKTTSAPFAIRPGVNKWLIIVPAVVVGGAVAALSGGGGKKDATGSTPSDEILPGPVSPH